MDEAREAPNALEPAPDLSVLEKIEGELFAVERALEQIDQGVYEGFAGLDDPPSASPSSTSPSVSSIASRKP